MSITNARERAAALNEAVNEIWARKVKYEKEHPDQEYPQCPICRGSGLRKRVYDELGNEILDKRLWNAPGTYDYYEPCECVADRKQQKKINNKRFASVPGLYKEARFDNFRTDVYRQMDSFTRADFAIKTARKYVENFDSMKQNGLGLYIWSSARGSGKSRLASTISNELTEKGIRNKYASASNILTEIQKTWDDKNESEATILRNYIEPEVLIVDDLGARSGQQWIDERFFSLFDTRYAELKVTIVTTNYNVDSLPFDERIRDRLADIDRFYEIPMPNETVRDKARATSGKTSLFDQLTREEG